MTVLFYGMAQMKDLMIFFRFFNTLDEKMKFTMEIGNNDIYFLDLKITIEYNKICKTVYSKPTDRSESVV